MSAATADTEREARRFRCACCGTEVVRVAVLGTGLRLPVEAVPARDGDLIRCGVAAVCRVDPRHEEIGHPCYRRHDGTRCDEAKRVRR